MKRYIALLLALLCVLPAFAACGAAKTSDAPEASVSSPFNSAEEEIPYADQDLRQSYGVYNIVTTDGKKVCIDNTGKFVLDYSDELSSRFTFHLKERIEDGKKVRYYALYKGDDEIRTIEVSTFLPDKAKLQVKNGVYDALLQDNATLFRLNAKLIRQNTETNARADRMHDQVLSMLTEVRELREKLAAMCVDTRDPVLNYQNYEQAPEIEITPEEQQVTQKYEQMDLGDLPGGNRPV